VEVEEFGAEDKMSSRRSKEEEEAGIFELF